MKNMIAKVQLFTKYASFSCNKSMLFNIFSDNQLINKLHQQCFSHSINFWIDMKTLAKREKAKLRCQDENTATSVWTFL